MPRQIIITTFKRPFIQIALGIGVAALTMIIFVIANWEKPSWLVLGRVGIVVVLVGFCCTLACIVPTRRALGIQPTEALKDEG